jgi:hypothetical protein
VRQLHNSEETDACFIVKDRAGMSLAYVYLASGGKAVHS